MGTIVIASLLILQSSTIGAGSTITFEQRVQAREAVARVYHSHQAGTLPFDKALSPARLEQMVLDDLKRDVALTEFWKRPVTADAVRGEMERIAARTRMPERLLEMYSALGNDPLLIGECLARPALVQRLTLSFFAHDRRIHAAARAEAEEVRQRLVRGSLDAYADHPRRTVAEWVRTTDMASCDGARVASSVVCLDSANYLRERRLAPRRVGEVGEIAEDRTAFQVSVVLSEERDRAVVASYRIPKRSWDDWWSENRWRFDEGHTIAVASETSALPPPPASDQTRRASPECAAGPDDVWNSGALDEFPERLDDTVVWTGSKLIVWGGRGQSAYEYGFDTGAVYDPVLDSWYPTSKLGAPAARSAHTAVWTGSEMIVWGGCCNVGPTGGRYNPNTDTWLPISTVNAPSERPGHTAVWTGTEMIVWGGTTGGEVNTGARYDPNTDTWTPMTTVNAPSARQDHTATWTGSQMIVWGGKSATGVTNSGGTYTPSLDRWAATPLTGAPAGRHDHTAVWTGSQMIVWGGVDEAHQPPALDEFNTGARFNPSTQQWSSTSTANAPQAHQGHVAVWTGSRMLVWGGRGSLTFFEPGGRYDPVANSWTAMSATNQPENRPTRLRRGAGAR